MRILKCFGRIFTLLFVGFTLLAVQACGDDEENGIFEDSQNASNIAVDLGLSVKWAAYNVGASSPEEYGGYYAWGETKEKKYYSGSDYKWRKSDGLIVKYAETVDNKMRLELSDDVAHVSLKGNWRMPTQDEMEELITRCSWEWTTRKGVEGQLVTGPNGNSIFLPAAGYRDGEDLYFSGSSGCYWSSTLDEDDNYYAYKLGFTGAGGLNLNNYRSDGLSVRPVMK